MHLSFTDGQKNRDRYRFLALFRRSPLLPHTGGQTDRYLPRNNSPNAGGGLSRPIACGPGHDLKLPTQCDFFLQHPGVNDH